MSFVVLAPGIDSRLVDFGRPRSRSLGVPVGGAADRRSLALGNALLGNPDDAPALEVTLQGPRLRAEADVGCVVYGAPFEIRRDGVRIPAGETFTLHAGEELHIGGTQWGLRASLCVRGGFHAPSILNSHSALEPIRAGETLACATSQIPRRYSPDGMPVFPEVLPLSVLPGLQASWFDSAPFYQQMFVVSPQSNRMGVRLAGKPLNEPEREMISEPVCPGAVQVTRDGQCIVLGIDGQTIGGYPKIAQVISPHLNLLGQARPGQKIKFVPTTLDAAAEIERFLRMELQQITLRHRLALDAFGGERTL